MSTVHELAEKGRGRRSTPPHKVKRNGFIEASGKKAKYEFYNRGYMLNIQDVIKNVVAGFEIDISAASHGYQGFKRGRRTNRSFGQITPVF
jgi:hypothetical protein